MSQHGESLQLYKATSWTGMNVMNFSSAVLNTEGEGDTPLSSEHKILYLSFLQPQSTLFHFLLHEFDVIIIFDVKIFFL